ncbi:MAG: chorismate mutase [Candidatus Pelagibacter sp.]|tara:strand:+ start:1283 stop:1570 length:288 start_codon:yes stop_codon:yes gene_type:complete
MSPKNIKELQKLRKKLDIVDLELLNIIKKRSILVRKVLSLKNFKNQIVDRKRINLILKKIKVLSIKKKIDPKITNRIWKNMIWAYIDYERRNFKK